ncbi:hypothetical protein ACQJBY_006028 [Aegilops geniculata]
MFARKMQKFAGRKKSWPARMRRRRDARCLHAQQQEAVREVLLWMLPSSAGPRCSTPPSPSPSSIGSYILHTASHQFSDIYKVYHHPMDHVLLINQVIEVEVNGVRRRSGVLIKKHRII